MLGRRGGGGPLDALNAREREVLGLMAEGRTNRAIAQLLFMSERAVVTSRRSSPSWTCRRL